MRPATTPKHVFKTAFNTALIDRIRITYAQFGQTVLQKETKDCEIAEGQITVRLTQQETLLFKEKEPIKIQGHIVTLGGEAFQTKIITEPVEEALDKEVL